MGEACEVEGQECIYPQSLCGTPCRCVNQPGGFVWECATQYCKCTCDCGRYAIASCELLECTLEDDPCVAQALPLCEMVCSDDAGPDGAKDGGIDQGGEGMRDQRVQEAGPDAAGDSAVDTSGPRDTAAEAQPDVAADLSADAAREAAVDASADVAQDTAVDLPRDATPDST